MKKVWIGLSITCILIGILGTAVDLIEGNSLEDTAVVLFVLWLACLALENQIPSKKGRRTGSYGGEQGKRKQRCVQRAV